MAELVLKDGSKKQFPDGISLAEAVKQLSNSLAKKVLVAKVNGEVTDLRETIVDGSTVEFLTFADQEGKDTLRHTASHVMAQAITSSRASSSPLARPLKTASTTTSTQNTVSHRKTLLPLKLKWLRSSKKTFPLPKKSCPVPTL